jgi:ferredoxin-NADP reductase
MRSPRPAELALVVIGRTRLADDVIGLELARPGGAILPQWDPGAHVEVVLANDQVRQYSLCSSPEDRSSWLIAARLHPGGRGGSRFLHKEVFPGLHLTVRGPRNDFPFTPADECLFIAGGIGITPLLPMLGRAAHTVRSWRLAYGGKRLSAMPFIDELTEYGDHVMLYPEDAAGKLPLDALLNDVAPGCIVYCCGPPALLDAVRLRCASWPEASLRTESFQPRPSPNASGTGMDNGFDVELKRSGTRVHVSAHESILQAVRRAGVRVLSSCEEGTCGTCETAVLAGRPLHKDHLLTAEERAAANVMMICVSRASAEGLTLDL